MKKNLILILCLSFIFILVGCNNGNKTNKSIQTTNQNQTLEDSSKDIKKATQNTNEQNNTTSIQTNEVSPNEQKEKDNISAKITKTNGKIKLHEGTYIDDKYYKEDLSKLKNYCELVISNVTDTSFNFTVYEINRETCTRKVIFLTNTAHFFKDEEKATFDGNNYTLNFTFPTITDIKISGFKPLEDNTYVNNSIPERKLYEGTYWDERCFGGDAILKVKKYCEIVISNVTDTSFDFTVYEVDRETKNKKVIFLTNTAIFSKDGKGATFHGDNYTLNFTFSYIAHIKISGFKSLEGRDYINNRIPGHECS